MVASQKLDQRSAELDGKVRRLYAAWPAGDRETVEELLADDFRFTSAYDDAIDRAQFFARCWPGHTAMADFSFKRVVVTGESVFVTYELRMRDGRRIENTELLQFSGGKVASVDVYFGATRDANGKFVAMKRDAS